MKHFRLKVTHDPKQTKLTFHTADQMMTRDGSSLNGYELKMLVHQVIVGEGGQKKEGQEPRPPLERSLQGLIRKPGGRGDDDGL